jgi:hypothetical protein
MRLSRATLTRESPCAVNGGGGDKSGVERVSSEVSAEQIFLSLCCQVTNVELHLIRHFSHNAKSYLSHISSPHSQCAKYMRSNTRARCSDTPDSTLLSSCIRSQSP